MDRELGGIEQRLERDGFAGMDRDHGMGAALATNVHSDVVGAGVLERELQVLRGINKE